MKPKQKIPNCKYAQANYVWHDTQPSGYVTKDNKQQVIDLRGYWELMGISCLALESNEEEHWKKFGCFFWCKNPDKCKLKKEGKPHPPSYMWTGWIK